MTEKIPNIQNVHLFLSSLPSEVLGQPKAPSKADYRDDILPFELYRGTRQNIEKIADQINKSFYNGIYDGASVLMRRLVEILLILAFKEAGQEEKIRGSDGNYFQLSQIIGQAVQNLKIDLTRNAKVYLGIFKEQGDLSAHNPFYNCTQKDLQVVQHKYRSLIEELFYKSGIRK